MTVLPVIERELRASARQPATYWIRVMGVLALFVVLFLGTAFTDADGPQMGGRLFGALHGTLFLAIWLLVPLLTADCISRERREGTLPLLFLTSLKPRDIVYAKGMAQGLRALTLWLAVLPILTVPLLLGGVGWPEIVMSVLVNYSSLCLAIAAGLLASAGTRVWNRALAVAACLAFGFAMVLVAALPLVLFYTSGFAARRFAFSFYVPSGPGFPLGFAMNWGGIWQEWLARMRFGPWLVLRAYLLVAVLSGFALLLVIWFAAWAVKRVWREEPPSARVQWLHHQLTRPIFFRPLLKRWLRWQLDRNPIGWLEQRSWSGRLVVWSWFAVVVCIYSSLFANFYLYQRGFHAVQSLMASLLAGSIALSSAGSFRRERETGVLELLLVAPLREWQIIGGRVRGLWAQFLPAFILLFGVWLYCATFLASENEWISMLIYAVAFATLPVVGLYFSLAKANFMAALLWTLLVGVGVPVALGQIAGFALELEHPQVAMTLAPPTAQVLIAALLAWRLHSNLRRRRFVLEAKPI